MTLVSMRNSERVIGRCDAKCYDATGPECTCVCGGKNHRAGLKGAINNTTKDIDKYLEKGCMVTLLNKRDFVLFA